MVTQEVKDRIGYLTLDRVEKRNALNDEMVTLLKEGLTDLYRNEKVKVVVIRANGEVFCAGADLAYLEKLRDNTLEENEADSRHLMELFQLIMTGPKLVVAAVQGHAIAGGCGLASVCDLVWSTENVKFGYTEVRIGFIPALVMVFLIKKIGESRARDLLLRGHLIDTEEAHRIGLVHEVMGTEEFAEEVHERAVKVASTTSAESIAQVKKMFYELSGMSIEEGLHYAARQNALARSSEDCIRGISAFLNKEKITW